MNKVDEIMMMVDYWGAHYGENPAVPNGIRKLIEALAQPAQEAEPELCDPSCGTYDLASMILSDCGHSSNNQRLLDRVAARIDKRLAAVIAASTQPQPAGEAEPETLMGDMVRLLEEVRRNYTRDDDLPNGLLGRIDAVLDAV